ncbi:MAG: hypothetical protein D6722_02880 [Bacteroidetes bacterium]|nr:MAG: hypothetical protein D6722_02880 [Bacteroidota bacterium]
MEIRTLFTAFGRAFRANPYMLLILALSLPVGMSAQIPFIFNAGGDGCPDSVQSFSNWSISDIAQTGYDYVYQTECAAPGTRTFVLKDPQLLPGNVYTLYLHFAEIYHGASNPDSAGGDGSRVFSVEVNGVIVLDSLDIYKEVGPNEALVYRDDVWVGPDSAIVIKFYAHTDYSKLSALELHPHGEGSSFPPDNAIRPLNIVSLPVEWGAFDLVTEPDGTLNLSWTTLREENTEAFEVEMSNDGETFMTLDRQAAAGYSETERQYHFRTQELDPGRYVFRLKQIDIDGQYSYSPRREWTVSYGMGLSLATPMPNPSEGLTRLEIMPRTDGELRMRLYSLDGREVRRFTERTLEAGTLTNISLDLQDVARGTYLLSLEANGERAHHLLRLQ